MASRKEYEMLFALNAQLNGGFSSTFSKAQAEFSRLGKEIQSLRSLQSDISAYQKQQGAVEATASKLQNLQKQHDLLQKEINETTGSTEALEREKLKLEQRISDTSANLERQRDRLSATGAKLKEAGVDTANLAQKDAELTAKIKNLSAEQDKAADSAASFGEKSAQAFGAVHEAIAAAGIAVALREIGEAYMECVAIAGDFEEGMSNVEALSGASADEMARLSDQAKELGATTKYTAQESAQAMGYMAMAGWDASEMLSGMDGVLQLASASGEDLARVSDIVTDNLSAFGLTAADTARFSDVLAAAATKSNTNVSIMGETFKMSASVAGALGYTIEDVAVAVGLMANSGVKGSIAGTALKNTFNGLLEGVTLTGAAFGECEYSAVKADGTMKSFGNTIEELRGYFDQMTEAERVNNAITIAGQYGYNGLLAILNATEEDYASLSQSINDCSGAAEKMAAIKMDNLNGELELMNGAWDALKTTIGEQFIPEMRTLYGVGADVFGHVDEFIQKHPALTKGIMAAAAAVGAGAVALTGVVTVTKVLIPAIGMLKAAMATVPGVNVIMGVTAAVAGLAGVVTALVTAANEGVPSVKELTTAARDMKDALAEADAAYADTATQTLATAEVAGIYIDKLEELEASLGDSASENQEYQNILALLTRTVPELSAYIDEETHTIDGGTEALRRHTAEWKKHAEAQAYQDYINSLYDEYGAVMQESAENSIKLTQAQIKLETAQKNYDATLARMNELSAEAAENGGILSQEYYDLQNSLYGYSDEMYQAERTIKNLNKAIDEDAEAVAAAQAEIDGAEEAVARLTGATNAQAEADAEAAAQAAELDGVIGGVTEQVAALTEAYTDAYNAALESISGQYSLWDEAATVVETSAGSINTALESQITYWQDYNANLQSLTERGAEIEGLSEMIASFADGSEASVNAIAGMASASDADLAAMVTNWKNLQAEQEAAAGSVADLKTDFTATMDELQAELAADIEAMDLGTEAAASGQATIQGFIDGANAMLPQVQAAYANLARAAQTALSPAGGGVGITIPGYAVGTQSAAPGFALVGENGPELVYFNGGEQVMTAQQTAAAQAKLSAEDMQMIAFAPQMMAAMSAYSGIAAARQENALPIGGGAFGSIQVVFQIQGNASPETVDALRAYGDEFAEKVLAVIEEAGVDAGRRAYV